jgi:hypothetical protein
MIKNLIAFGVKENTNMLILKIIAIWLLFLAVFLVWWSGMKRLDGGQDE